MVGWGCGGVLGLRTAMDAKDLALSFFPETIQPSGDGGQVGALAGCAEVLWLPIETGGRAFGLKAP